MLVGAEKSLVASAGDDDELDVSFVLLLNILTLNTVCVVLPKKVIPRCSSDEASDTHLQHAQSVSVARCLHS